MNQIKVDPFQENLSVTIGFQKDHNKNELVFENLETEEGKLFYLDLGISDTEYQPIPLVDNKWTVTSTYTDKAKVFKAQIVEKIDEQMVGHTPIFELRVRPSVGGVETVKETVPPAFQTAYEDMINVTEEVETKLENGEFNGKDGENGKSAYEIAVENGFEGTEKEWLESLDYEHSEEFTQLANQVREDAEKSSQALELTNQNKSDVEKLVSDFNIDYDSKLQSFNTNATEKTEAFNENVSNATNAFNSAVQEANTQIDEKVQEATEQAEKAKTEADRATQATDGKLDKNQGTDNKGKVMVVGEDGELIPTEYKSGSDNKLIGTVSKSENPSVTDSYNTELMNLIFYGKSTQESTNGYQLFDASKLPTTSAGGATVTNNGDGSFTISGSGDLSDTFSISYTLTTDEAVKLIKQGTLNANFENISSPRFIYGIYLGGTPIGYVNNGTKTSASVNITEEMISKLISGEYAVKVFIYGDVGSEIKVGTVKPMIYQDGDGTWEEFTGGQPSPNPKYKQDVTAIEQVSGAIMDSYQLFDASKLATKSNGGATVTNNGDGSFTISGSGELTSVLSIEYTFDTETALNLLKVGNLYLKETQRNTVPYFIYGLYNSIGKNVNIITNLKTNVDTTNIYITQDDLDKLSSGEYKLKTYIYGIKGRTITPTTIKPMVYQDGDGTWQPFDKNPQEVSFIPPQPLYSTPDGSIADVVNVANGQYEYNMSGAVVFDGNEDWQISGALYTDFSVFLLPLTGAEIPNNVWCNKFENLKEFINITSEGIFIHNYDYSLRIAILKSRLSSLDVQGFKQWLSENPITVVYPVATPTTQPIPQETLAILRTLQSYNGVTNFLCNALASFDYEQSIQITIQKIWDAIGQTNANILLNGGNN